MRASLPMYDFPEIRPATDALWTAVASHLGAPAMLERGGAHTELWSAPDMLFSQTCGYPLTHEYHGKLQVVATPHYAAEGCGGPNYRSFVMAREAAPLEAFRGSRAAVNSPNSMSGMLALQLVFAPLARDGRFFSSAVLSGGHLLSLAMVRDGEAEVCAIDCVTLALARRHKPDLLRGLAAIAESPAVPGLPFVTSIATPAGQLARLRDAFAAALADPALANARAALLIDGVSHLTAADYAIIPRLEREMQARGGLALLS